MNKHVKRLLPLLITVLFAFFIFRRGIRWQDFQAVVHQAKWGWLLVALFWQAASYGAVTSLNEILLQHYGARVPWRQQYLIQLAMAFIEAVIPSAAISGAVLRVRLLKSHGVKPDVATATTIAEMILVFGSVVLLALPVAWIAALKGVPGIGGNAGFWLFILIALSFGAVIMHRQWRTPHFSDIRRRAARRLSHLWDAQIRYRWPQRLDSWPSDRMGERIHYLSSEMWVLLRERPLAILLVLLARSLFEALGLMMCFYALGQTLPLPTLILVYTLTIAADSLGAIPGGIGLAEVSLTAVYTGFGLSLENAVAIALAYRLTNYWLPRFAGGLSWLWLERTHPQRILDLEAMPQ